MRVLVASTAGAGHLAGLIPFARACVELGHDVRVAAPASFAASVAAAGFPHEPVADAAPDVLGAVFGRIPTLTMREADDLVIGEVFGRIDLASALPGMREVVRRWRPDVLLREPAELASYVAAEEHGVPHVQCNTGLDSLDDRVLPLLVGPLAEVGSDDGGLRAAPRWTVVPPAVDQRANGATGPLTAAREPGSATATGAPPPGCTGPGDPLVYVTFGSVAAGIGLFPVFYATVLQQLAALPVRVLLTVGEAGDPAALGPVPANVTVERWWPQADVMPHASVVVGHGGFGTTQAALVAGLPQVVVPLFSFDQFVNAARVAAVGAGLALTDPGAADLPTAQLIPGGPRAASGLGAAVATVLDEEAYRDRARAVVREVEQLPTTTEVVASLVDLV